jgi:hypothetical protein
MTTESKMCGACRVSKVPSEFHKNAKLRDGLTNRCKTCAIAAARASYERKVRERNPGIDLVREHRDRLMRARKAGDLLFTPLLACPSGHLTPRYTGSQCCKECGKVRRREMGSEASRLEKKKAGFKRSVAIKNGLAHYLGAACKRGHEGKRLVSTRQCVECLAGRAQDRKGVLSEKAVARKRASRRSRVGRSKQRKYQSEVLMNRPGYKVQRFMYESLRRLIAGSGIKKKSRTAEALGYDRNKLMARIECQFGPGMSWENHGEWHIDHRKPISAFIAAGDVRPHIINALSNLRPMWAGENLRKGGAKRKKATAA